ncbi:unnamed protein product [Prorocentrum cordatum]|uniref:Uncharacterized protein n=1 Tax=Prorocentrum cordatum TaxID=2364126 RepID=A0ABN9T3H2_9DINO|nr:unnamed protein product [Polarella glacialis]
MFRCHSRVRRKGCLSTSSVKYSQMAPSRMRFTRQLPERCFWTVRPAIQAGYAHHDTAGFECARRPRPIFAAAYGWVFCLANFLCPALASANQGRRHWACAKRSRRRRRTRLRRASDCCGARSRLCRAGAPRGCTAARRRSSPVEEFFFYLRRCWPGAWTARQRECAEPVIDSIGFAGSCSWYNTPQGLVVNPQAFPDFLRPRRGFFLS